MNTDNLILDCRLFHKYAPRYTNDFILCDAVVSLTSVINFCPVSRRYWFLFENNYQHRQLINPANVYLSPGNEFDMSMNRIFQ